MKLRIRSLESKETLKIQTPSPSSLQDLKNVIADTISAASPENLQISLNRKDKIVAAPHDSLQSLGIASGDLIFYSLNPNAFPGTALTETQIPVSQEETPISNLTQTQEQGDSSRGSESNSGKTVGTLTLVTEEEEETPNASNLEKTIEKGEGSSLLSESSKFDSVRKDETQALASEEENMEITDDENPDVVVEKTDSVPCFLKKVLKEEVSNIEGADYKLLVIAVHAVLLESGFVAFDSVVKKKIGGFHLPEGWASKSITLSVKYTVQDLLGSGSNAVETVSLVFQTLGKFVNVHGSLSRNGKDMYKLCLDKSKFVPSINFVLSNCNSTDAMDLEDESSSSSSNSKSTHESKVFEFWKIAKDRLALPLLIDLCDKTGLASPPCFTLLPTDLKLKILEFLPGVDIARIGCVSSELKYLSSNNDLWKQKVEEEFGQSGINRLGNEHWKETFVTRWKFKNNMSVRRIMRRPVERIPDSLLFHNPGRRPVAFPGIIGGDYDLFPAPLGSQRTFQHPARRQFMPGCNLGGF